MAVTVHHFQKFIPTYNGVQYDGTTTLSSQIVTYMNNNWPGQQLVQLNGAGLLQVNDPATALGSGFVDAPTNLWILICRSAGHEDFRFVTPAQLANLFVEVP